MLLPSLTFRSFVGHCVVGVDSRCGAIYQVVVDHELVLDHDILSRLQVSKSRFLPVERQRDRDRHRGDEQHIPVQVPQDISRGGFRWAIERFVRENCNFTLSRKGLDFSRDGESCRALGRRSGAREGQQDTRASEAILDEKFHLTHFIS